MSAINPMTEMMNNISMRYSTPRCWLPHDGGTYVMFGPGSGVAGIAGATVAAAAGVEARNNNVAIKEVLTPRNVRKWFGRFFCAAGVVRHEGFENAALSPFGTGLILELFQEVDHGLADKRQVRLHGQQMRPCLQQLESFYRACDVVVNRLRTRDGHGVIAR